MRDGCSPAQLAQTSPPHVFGRLTPPDPFADGAVTDAAAAPAPTRPIAFVGDALVGEPDVAVRTGSHSAREATRVQANGQLCDHVTVIVITVTVIDACSLERVAILRFAPSDSGRRESPGRAESG